MGFTLDSTGKPVISSTPTQTVADMQAIADYAQKYAFARSGLASVRTGLAPGELWNGLTFFETDTGSVYIYNGGWRLWHRVARSYTPTLTSISGSPSVVGRYSIESGMVTGTVQVTLAAATMGSSPMVSLPVAAQSASNKPIVGFAQYSDVSPGGYYFGHVRLESTTNVALMDTQVVGSRLAAAVYLSSTTPFTWAAGDVINLNFTYEAA